MITAFDVYVVMMADRAVQASACVAIISGPIAFGVGLAALLFDGEEGKRARAALKLPASLFIGSLCAFVLIPDTKTLAAMYVLPAITSDQVTEPVTKEAAELYQLAKGALKRLAEEPTKQPEPEK